jgi:hypothetical protein
VAQWQILLIIIGAVAVGLVIGYFVSILISNLIPALFRRREPVEKKKPVKTVSSSSKHSRVPVISDSLSKLIAEIEDNRRLSSSEWVGELQPFKTNVWDNQGEEVHSLPTEIRNELGEAYSDMALANSITWLSTEMKRRSPSLDESYTRLRNNISERLNRIITQLKSNGLAVPSTPAQNI